MDKNKQLNIQENEKEEVDSEKKAQKQIDYSFVISEKTNNTANENITQVYDRKNYDSPSARKKFIEDSFGEKKVITDAAGQKVHSSHNAAKSKYKSNSSFHQAEADHIDPLKNIQQRHKNNPYLSDQDIKNVANRNSNFQVINKHDNTSKGAKSEIAVGIEERDLKKIAKGTKARIETDVELSKITVKNMGKQATSVAPQAAATAAVAIVYDGLNILPDLISGEITGDEAAKRLAKTGVTSFVSVEGFSLVMPKVNLVLQNSTNEILKTLGNSGNIGIVISTATIIASATTRLICGEIDCLQFAKEVTDGGVSLAASIAISSVCGPIVGTVATIAFNMLYSSAKKAFELMYSSAKKAFELMYSSTKKVFAENALINNEHKERMEFLEAFVSATETELNRQSEKLEKLFEEEKNEWNLNYSVAIKNINEGIISDNPEQINDGLGVILESLNVNPKFNNANEFRSFLNSSNRKITI